MFENMFKTLFEKIDKSPIKSAGCFLGLGFVAGGILFWFEYQERSSEFTLANSIGISAMVTCWSLSLLILEYRSSMDGVRADHDADEEAPNYKSFENGIIWKRRKPLIWSFLIKTTLIIGALFSVFWAVLTRSRTFDKPIVHYVGGSGTILDGIYENMKTDPACRELTIQEFSSGSVRAIDALYYQKDKVHGIALSATRFTPASPKPDPLYESYGIIEIYLGHDDVNLVANSSLNIKNLKKDELRNLLKAKSQEELQLGGVKNIEMMLPRGCGDISGTCAFIAEQYLGPGEAITAPLSSHLKSAYIKGLLNGIRKNDKAVGFLSTLFYNKKTDDSDNKTNIVTVDEHPAVIKRHLWAYAFVENSGNGPRVLDPDLVKCILNEYSSSRLGGQGGQGGHVSNDAYSKQLQWLTGKYVDQNYYVRKEMNTDGAALWSLKDDPDGEAMKIRE